MRAHDNRLGYRFASTHTKAALAAAKARGARRGNPNGAAALHRAGKGNAASVAAHIAAADEHARNILPIIGITTTLLQWPSGRRSMP